MSGLHLWAVPGMVETSEHSSEASVSLGRPLCLCLPCLVHGGVRRRERAAWRAVQTRYPFNCSLVFTETYPNLYFALIGHLCCHCRWTRDLMVQEWGGEDGLWHPKCLEDIWHQQQVQVDGAFFQDTASVLISELQLEDGSHPLLSLANSTSQYVLNSGWLCYCTPWVLNPGQIRGRPRIRCLQTETFVEPSQSFGVPSPCLTLLFVPFCTARLCPSYPQQLLVPAWITDKELENVAAFRSWKRFPAVVYRFVFISSAAIQSRHLACLSLER